MRSGNKRVRIEQLPAARMTLILLAGGNALFWCFLYLLPWNVILLLSCIFGATSLFVCLLSIPVLNGIIIALMKQTSLEFRCSLENMRVMRRLLSERSAREKLKDMKLVRSRNAWEAIDEASYIRVGKGSAAILFASEINFASAGIHTERAIRDPSRKREFAEKRSFHRYRLTRKDGKQAEIQLDQSDSFLKWLSAHHGRTVYQKKEE